MDWTAIVTDVTDDLPNSDLLNVSVNFSNGTDSFDNVYKIHANDYADSSAFTDFLSTELQRFVAVKDLANSIKSAAKTGDPLATTKAKETPVILDGKAELGATPEVG